MSDAFDVTERILYLRQVPVGAMLPPSLLRLIATYLEPRTFQEGERVAAQGEPVDAMYLLTDGGFSLLRDGAPFATLDAPQSVGFLGILARQESTYNVVARRETRAFELDTDTLLELFDDHFTLFRATLKYLAERIYFDFQEMPASALSIPPLDLGIIGDRAIDLPERVLMMRKMSAFTSANINALTSMTRKMIELRAKPGTKLWSIGEAPERGCFVLEGTIACRAADGRAFRYGAGTAVGGVELLAGRPRWYEAITETPVVALLGEVEDLLDLFEQQNRMAMDFVASLARAQLAILEARAKLGRNPLAVRDVSKLGAARVGA